MTPHPNSPRALADALGLALDLSIYNSPAVVGPTGKRHYYSHGQSNGRKEATLVLARLIRIRASRSAYREELTPHGIQLTIPGTERVAAPGKPATAQLSLFG